MRGNTESVFPSEKSRGASACIDWKRREFLRLLNKTANVQEQVNDQRAILLRLLKNKEQLTVI